jgi:hypothetical protein
MFDKWFVVLYDWNRVYQIGEYGRQCYGHSNWTLELRASHLRRRNLIRNIIEFRAYSYQHQDR